MSTAEDVPVPGRRVAVAAAGLAVVTCAVFAPSLADGFVNFDDPGYVTENVHVRGGLSLASVAWALTAEDMSNWHPLTWLSHLLDVSLFGLDARGHHLTSVLLHSVNAALALVCGVRLTRRLAVALPAAALFALHPLRVESVTWIAERKDVLAALFFFVTLWLWTAGVRSRQRSLKAAACLSFLCGLLAKPMLVTMPPLLIVVDVCFLGRAARTARERRALLLDKAPFFALAAASSLVTLRVQRDAMMPLASYGAAARIAAAPVHVVRYLSMTLWPAGLSALDPLPRHGTGALAAAGAGALLLALTMIAWRVRRTAPAVLGGWLWFIGMLVPVIGLVQAGRASVADRYTYLPHVGLFLALAAAAAQVAARGPALLCALALACVPVTVEQIRVWRTSRTLFEHALEVGGGSSAFLNDALAGELLEQHSLAEAERCARRAHELSPDDARYATRLAQVLAVAGDDDDAEALLWTTLKRHPHQARGWFYLSALERKDGRDDDARRHLLRALALSAGSDAKLHERLRAVAGQAGIAPGQ